ncbi:unnamed protein product [Phytomonas sp. EM1]|nr:unnamed protein product [Phytomonas sp. EM1]|eukprot:CCW63870.1 unnamed protein product [Phytomonas sp. isolate EM1]
MAACARFVVLGSRGGATIAMMEGETLSGRSALDLHLGGNPAASGADAVLQVAIVSEILVLCTLASRKVIGVATPASKELLYHQIFVLAPPQPLERPLGNPAGWRLAVPSGGFTIGAFWCETELVYLHLPTTLEHAKRQQRLYGAPGVAVAGSNSLETTPLEGVKVLPFLKGSQEDGGEAGTVGDREPRPRQGGGPSEEIKGVSALRRANVSPIDAFRFPRHPLVFDATHTRASWVDVNAVEGRGGGGARPGVYDSSSQAVALDGQRVMTVLSRALHSDRLDDATCRYNMEKLHAYLNKYGVFPSKYRAAIWRFILGLPNKRLTAPQFASLARRPPHECVAVFLKPFGLPPGRLRHTLEGVLSALAHHAPVFAIASFLPAMVYPLIRVYEDDAQSILEVVLSFLSNWGREFFVCYPQAPSMLGAFLTRQLEKRDRELAGHLTQIGAGFEVWGWDAMLSFYTDMLTGPEWLQVMDHAFMMEPMWLFMFHLAYLVHLREGLLTLRSAHEVLEELRQPHSGDFSVSAVIVMAYEMLQTCPRNAEFMKPYFIFQGWGPSYEYPNDFICDAEVLEAKSSEIHLLTQREHEKAITQARLLELQEEAEAAALHEEMLLHRERAVIAAKYDSSADLWRSRVELERARQERIKKERELRLFIVDSKLASAEQMESLEGEKQQVERQLRDRFVDGLMAEQAWVLGEQLTDHELAELEKNAEARMNAALQKLVGADSNEGVEKPPIGMARPPLSASFSFPPGGKGDSRVGSTVELPTGLMSSANLPVASSLTEEEPYDAGRGDFTALPATSEENFIPTTTPSGVDDGPSFPALADAPGEAKREARPNDEDLRVAPKEPVKSAGASDGRPRSRSFPQTNPPSPPVGMASEKPPCGPPEWEKGRSPRHAAPPPPPRHLEPFQPFSAWCESRTTHDLANSTSATTASLYDSTQQRYLAMQRRAIGAEKKVSSASGRGGREGEGKGKGDSARVRRPHEPADPEAPKTDPASSVAFPRHVPRPALYDNMPRSTPIPPPANPHWASPAVERMRAFYASHPLDSTGIPSSSAGLPTASTSIATSTTLPTNTTTIAPSSSRVEGKGKGKGGGERPKTSLTTYATSSFSSRGETTSAASVIDRPHRDSYYFLPPPSQGGGEPARDVR